MVSTLGKMAESTKANISLIRNMDSAHILGKTAGNILGSGGIVKGMEGAKSSLSMAVRGKAFGRMTLK